MARVLVAGVGNVLTGDDGFGVRVLEAIESEGGLPPGARAIEIGIGGIHLVQELMEGYDALVLVDAAHRGGEPGTIYVLEPDVPDLSELPEDERRAFLAETHYAIPLKALALARGLAVLPDRVYIVGCEPGSVDLGIALTPRVAEAIGRAAARVRKLTEALVEGRTTPGAAQTLAEEASDVGSA